MPGMQKIPDDIILGAVAKLGPCQPIDIRKEIGQGDTMLIGALLSQLVGQGKLAITKVRRGGGPFYYDPNAPERIDEASQWLNEKDRRTYAMLKEQRVMREDSQDPLVRVGLKNMPDFSKPIEIDGVMYWKHYMLSDDEAATMVKGEPVEMKQEEKEQQAVQEESILSDIKEEILTTEPEKKEKKTKSKKKSTEETSEQPAKPAPKRKGKKEPEPIMMPDGAVMISPQEWLAHDTLYERVKSFAGDMKLRDARVHKPHSELTCIMRVATQFGDVDTFVHAFNKKFTADDIKTSLPRARELGLPVLILSVDAIPSKVTSAFKGMPNILFKRFEAK